MMTFTKVFEQHLNQQFPPKFVFCINDWLEVRSILVTDIPDLDKYYTYTGNTVDYPEMYSLCGSLPMVRALATDTSRVDYKSVFDLD